MIFILAIGVLSAIFGLLLLVSPKTILEIEQHANKVILTDPFFLKYRRPLGFFLIAGSAYMIYVFYTS
ncbi:MAG: hypothetical protein HOL10_10410 [Candidatus Marinimicrobia bacterium]|jgi:hypothetical protein|nr:hypothetical protein [Candidatus Neomarinimicrobiota bacterium]MBT5760713.1 hypothetical protein [Candidatus Neomarinimicrobiota bacterium]MBT6862022.1 hypothetical protein [Candidatus Neomarinimicrobiota bacterium]